MNRLEELRKVFSTARHEDEPMSDYLFTEKMNISDHIVLTPNAIVDEDVEAWIKERVLPMNIGQYMDWVKSRSLQMFSEEEVISILQLTEEKTQMYRHLFFKKLMAFIRAQLYQFHF
jgi:hypothetical protein